MAPATAASILGLLLLASGAASAQSATAAYPWNSTESPLAHVTPFGFNATRQFDECRFQQRIPARHLPSNGDATITALAVVGAITDAAVQYERLQIVIGLAAADERPSGLAFDDNFLPGSTVTVLDATDLSVTWTANAWTRLVFDEAFAYDGSGDLVVEIRKRVDPARVSSSPPVVGTQLSNRPIHHDLPPALYVASAREAGAWDAALADAQLSSPMSLQLELTNTSTLTTRSARSLFSGNLFSLGSFLTLDVQWPQAVVAYPGSTTSRWSVVFMHTGFATTPLQISPVDGFAWLPFATAPPWIVPSSDGLMPAHATRSTTLWLPWNHDLLGFRAAFQGLVVEVATSTLHAHWTNAIDIVVQP